MNHVAAVVERDQDRRQVMAAAEAIAQLWGVESEALTVPVDGSADRARRVVHALRTGHVAVAAMSARGPQAVCWEVMTRVPTPLLIVPRRSEDTLARISRVLLPLDGTLETAEAVAEVARRAAGAGAAVVAMHVFDAVTVPAFWDQAAHAHRHWTREFLRRYLPEAVDLDLRSGRPAEEVIAEADASDVDLIVLAWNRNLGTGRATTVRHAVAEGLTPVLLVGTRP